MAPAAEDRKSVVADIIRRQHAGLSVEDAKAVRDPKGRCLGTLEVTQDTTEIRKLTGERRLPGG